jgi:ppGpp synthetase/RelA/SpoT-type nucleotidyltranferase
MKSKFNSELIKGYQEIKPSLTSFSKKIQKVLDLVLRRYISPEEYYIRKSIMSLINLAELISDPTKSYANPLLEIPDLVSLKVIVFNKEIKNRICEVIRKNFKIKRENPEVNIQKQNSQGYKGYQHNSHIFIITLNSNSFYKNNYEVNFPESCTKFLVEIQVRTILEHALKVNQSNVIYKREFDPPELYKQELNRIAALLETADKSINEIQKKLQKYERSYGAYMSIEEIDSEIERLEVIYSINTEDIPIGHRLAKLLMERSKFSRAKEILNDILKEAKGQKLPQTEEASIMRDLGVSICNSSDPNRERDLFESGQNFLKQSIKLNPRDTDAYASLGGTYKKLNMHKKAKEWYQEALNVDPNDPYPLVNYLIYELRENENPQRIINYHRSQILNAIKIRSDHIRVLVDIPWANFDVGTLALLLNKIHVSFHNFLLGIRLSQHNWMIETTLNTLEKLGKGEYFLEGIEIIKTLLLLGLYYHPEEENDDRSGFTERILSKLQEASNLRLNRADFGEPIVIISGEPTKISENELELAINNFKHAFENFEGTIISWGIDQGVGKIASALKQEYNDNIRLIGYSPEDIPEHEKIQRGANFEHKFSSGEELSILEPLQYWFDIMRSKVQVEQVKFLGVGGGSISELEYRMAITFGAQVGIIENSGGAANTLINDRWWNEVIEREGKKSIKKLFNIIPNKSEKIKNFLHRPFITDKDIQNIRKLLIQHKDGVIVYEKNFSENVFPGDLMSGLMAAVQKFSKEIGLGEIPTLTASQGTVTMSLFTSENYRIYFFLQNEPSKPLKSKIKMFTEVCEAELENKFKDLRQIQTYDDDKEMSEILASIFGKEILKFFG